MYERKVLFSPQSSLATYVQNLTARVIFEQWSSTENNEKMTHVTDLNLMGLNASTSQKHF